jgi:hypothetical protein
MIFKEQINDRFAGISVTRRRIHFSPGVRGKVFFVSGLQSLTMDQNAKFVCMKRENDCALRNPETNTLFPRSPGESVFCLRVQSLTVDQNAKFVCI